MKITHQRELYDSVGGDGNTFDDGIEDVLVEEGHLLSIVLYDGCQPFDLSIGSFKLGIEEDLSFRPQGLELLVDVTALTEEQAVGQVAFAPKLFKHVLLLQ